jgi:hypothetical protein
MKRSTIYLGVGLLLLFLVWAAFRQSQKQEAASRTLDPKNQTSKPGAVSLSNDPEKDLGKEEGKIVLHAPDPALKAELQTLKSRLAQKPDRETVLRLLREFMQKAFSANPDTPAAALLEFLRTGEDLSTSLGFVVGEAGLDEWPTLRAFLLDLLGKIDPEMASRYALQTVIPAKSSTVEYAVSLQILWNHGGAEKPTPELTQAWLGLLKKADWSARPDPAWLESLDFASRIPEATPEFLKASTDWLGRPKEAFGKAEAAEIVLERMMIRHPGETLSALLDNTQWMNEGRGPAVRASLFARADVTDSGQALSLKSYLQHLQPDGKEAGSFYEAFPCHNYGVAPGLSGQPDIPGAGDIQNMLRADLVLLQGWKNDPSMVVHRPWFDQAIEKIRGILGPKG